MFVDIVGFDKYEINEYGDIKNKATQRILKQKIDKHGYAVVGLYKDKRHRIWISVHRLVACAFVDGHFEGAVVNHKDGNKLNNHIDNLEWCTIQENTLHAYENDLNNFKDNQLKASRLGAEKNKMKISVYKDGVYIDTYDSKGECAKALNVHTKTIYNWLHGKTKNTKGYVLITQGGDANAK